MVEAPDNANGELTIPAGVATVGEAAIADGEYPKGSKPGDFGERAWTPAEKFVLPRPAVVGDSKGLPDPPVAT